MTDANYNKARTAKIYRWRFHGVTLVIFLLAMLLVWHLVKLQVLPDTYRGFEFLQKQGLVRTLRTETISVHRGLITDRYGEPLAVSTPVISLWANPKQLLQNESTNNKQIAQLAEHLSLSSDSLMDKLSRYRDKEFMYLRRRLTPAQAEQVIALGIQGVYQQQEFQRFYPAGEVAAHVVGFTNIDGKGQEGFELAYDQWLSGRYGKKQVLKDLTGRTIKDVALLEEAKPGNHVALSIDLRLQHLAYRELKKAVNIHQAKSASMVMLDAQTGEVLAMVNQPSFNPNNRDNLQDLSALRNRVLTDQYEPGSTMKPLTVMAALESGRYEPNTEIDTNPGFLKVGKKTLLDPVNYGVIDLTKIIAKSSQVGLTKVSLSLDPINVRDLFFRLGLGQSTGLGFPGESLGLLPNYSRWQPIVQANFSFGYGLTLNTLQLAQAYSVIANHGKKKPLSILKQDVVPEAQQVVDKAVAKKMVSMLKAVVEKGGTATQAELPTYGVAGKTGTVHKVGKEGYADSRYISLFAGFAPADNPKIVAVVVVHEPSRGKYFGGEVAAPVFAKVIERSLQILQVPPLTYVRPLT